MSLKINQVLGVTSHNKGYFMIKHMQLSQTGNEACRNELNGFMYFRTLFIFRTNTMQSDKSASINTRNVDNLNDTKESNTDAGTMTDYILELSDPPIFFEQISSSTKIFYDKDNQQIYCVRSNGVGGMLLFN